LGCGFGTSEKAAMKALHVIFYAILGFVLFLIAGYTAIAWVICPWLGMGVLTWGACFWADLTRPYR